MKNTEVFDTLSRRDNVLGLGLCGSWRMNTHDRYSDVDVWVFVDPATPLSDAYCLDTLIPHGLRMEVLSEGRDDSLVPFSVYNVLTEDGILNLKFISLKVLTDFVHAVPSYDHGYLDDLENYQTMQVLFERQDILSLHQRFLTEKVLPPFLPALTTELVSRYASTYWRSVFQGFLRRDEHSWRLLMSDMVKYLADVSHLTAGRLPAARKWALADAVLGQLPHGAALQRCLEVIAACDVANRQQVLGCYHVIGQAEELILDTDQLHRDFWWRSVFHKRLPNLDLPETITSLEAGFPPPARTSAR